MAEAIATKRNTKDPKQILTLDADKAIKILALAVDKAIGKLDIAADVAVGRIGAAVTIASNLVASDALNARKVVGNDAAAAVLVNSATSSLDHDLLVELNVKMKLLMDDIGRYKNDKADKHDVDDLKTAVYKTIEDRLRKVENKTANYFITISLYSIVVTGMIGLILYHILHTV